MNNVILSIYNLMIEFKMIKKTIDYNKIEYMLRTTYVKHLKTRSKYTC